MLEIKIADDKTGETIETIPCRFKGWQTVYYVEQYKKRVYVIETQITGIAFTNILSYRLLYKNYCIPDESKNLFDNFEEAMNRAEELDRRKSIKIIR